ncbi:MAG: Outer membrane protein OprM [Chlamydiae bacterium]|nr:Outer membrane protein OprM [Chlamydiota bacterium]
MKISDLNQNKAFIQPSIVNPLIESELSEPYFKVGSWPTSSWWKSFNSQELNTFVEEALASNPTILSIEQKVEAAHQVVEESKSPLFPAVFFNASEDWGKLSKNGIPYQFNPSLGSIYNLVDLNLNFKYEFDFWGKNRNALKASVGLEKSQRAEYKQVELMITTTLAKAYFALKTNLQRRELYIELKNIQLKVLELNNLLERDAMRSKIDPATATEDLESITKEIFALDNEINQNKTFINILKGSGPSDELKIDENLNPVPKAFALPVQLSSDLIIRRPDLVASIWKVESLVYDVNVSVADFFPRVDLLGFIGLESFPFKYLLDWKSRQGRLQPSIHIPIFKAGEIRAKYRKNKAKLEGAIFDYNDLLLKSLKEAADNIVTLSQTYKQKNSQKIILNRAQLKLDLYELRYERGIDSLLTVYNAQEELIRKKLDDLMITYEQYVSIVQLIKSLGGGYCETDLKGFFKEDING